MALQEKPTIAIVGGGLAGLTLSIGLTRQGIPHKIYESASKFAEIGAGIALGPNSITALELIDPRIKDALRRCVTYNEGIGAEGDGKGKEEWLDVRVGDEEGFNHLITTVCHTSSPKPGRACVHRAKFLDELIKLIPPSTASFGKSLTSISENTTTGLVDLKFADDTFATASMVLACDGIKSVVRQHVLSHVSDNDLLRPVFANEFAYRAMFPHSKFLEITKGMISAGKGTLFCGPDSYAVMYPVEKGALMNMVAVKRLPVPTPDSFAAVKNDTNWIQPVTQEVMLTDFTEWGTPIKALLSNIQRPERWALYDHRPAPTFIKGRVALVGDSAHATTPHQGQGAGMAFEDSLILSGILGEILNEQHTSANRGASMNIKLKACLRAYDEVRRPRTHDLTRTSREMGEIIGYTGLGIGRDLDKIKGNLDTRMNWIWDVDLLGEVSRGVEIARGEFKSML